MIEYKRYEFFKKYRYSMLCFWIFLSFLALTTTAFTISNKVIFMIVFLSEIVIFGLGALYILCSNRKPKTFDNYSPMHPPSTDLLTQNV